MPSSHTHRPKAFAKKSRSTTNWPILACNFVTSAAVNAVSEASTFDENVAAIPSIAAFFQIPTRVRWMPCFAPIWSAPLRVDKIKLAF